MKPRILLEKPVDSEASRPVESLQESRRVIRGFLYGILLSLLCWGILLSLLL